MNARGRRPYRSPHRKAQAEQTRHTILAAALRLFEERGYTGAAITAIAAEAGVSAETVYGNFGSKKELLVALLDVSLLGDEEPVPLLDRSGPRAVRTATDQREQMRLFAADMASVMARVGPLFRIMHAASAAEPTIATLLGSVLQQRLEGMHAFVRAVASNGPLRAGLDADTAAETVWAISGAEVHWLLTTDRGWSPKRYREWLGDTLIATLLPGGEA